MAERRMFSRSVVGSARFLKMPTPSKLLYYDLGMEADDDGFVEAFSVLRKTGATEDDLSVLVSNSFVKVMDEDLVTYILHWKQNNFIRSDRYRPSVYKHLLLQIDVGIPMVDQRYTQDSIGKGSIGKGSIGKYSIGEEGAQEKGVKGEKPLRGMKPSENHLAAYYRHILDQSQQQGKAGKDQEEGDLYE